MMGIELELGVLLAIAILGQSIFAVFEVETPAWRKVLKWTILSTATIALYAVAGHWALVLPAIGAVLGASGHLWWCRRNAIHPLTATPRRRYYQLRGWPWPDSGPPPPGP